MAPKQDEPRYPIHSLLKTGVLLDKLAEVSGEIGVVELSQLVGLTPSNTHRLLDTLQYLGYVDRNHHTQKYKLGLRLFQLGCTVVNQMGLGKYARPHLDHLAAVTGETANLGIMHGTHLLYVDKVDSEQMLRTGISVGTEAPLWCTGLGKALLAFASPEQVKAILNKGCNPDGSLPLSTKKSVASVKEVHSQLRSIRELGYAVDDEEYMDGVSCIAAPILNGYGVPVAAVSVSFPSSRHQLVDAERLFVGEIRKVANLISAAVM